MSGEVKKEYVNEDLTVVWKPGLCIHAAACIKALPKVYNPQEKPWIKIENASTEELKAQVKTCPSGALSYYMNGVENQESLSLETNIEVLENGPLLVYGTLKIKDASGNEDLKNKTTAFCRCGASNNKPYCDGSHVKAGFKG